MQETPSLLLTFMQNHKLLKSKERNGYNIVLPVVGFFTPNCFQKKINFTIEIDPQQEIPFWVTFPHPLPVNLILPICEAVLHFFTLIVHWETCSWKQVPQAPPHHSPSDAHHLRGLCSHNSREVLCCLAVNWRLSRSAHQSQIHICTRTGIK